MTTKALITKFEMLPKPAQKKVAELIESLFKLHHQKKKGQTEQRGMTFEWEGGLADLRDKYTSVELQHKINELR